MHFVVFQNPAARAALAALDSPDELLQAALFPDLFRGPDLFGVLTKIDAVSVLAWPGEAVAHVLTACPDSCRLSCLSQATRQG